MTPSAQLLEQTARLQSLSDTLARLKVIRADLSGCSPPSALLSTLPSSRQDEVAEHIVNQQRGARASSDFATFPSTLFVKVRARPSRLGQSVSVSEERTPTHPPTHPVPQAKEEKQADSVLVGRVLVPCPRGQEQVHRLVLPQRQLQRIHSLLRS